MKYLPFIAFIAALVIGCVAYDASVKKPNPQPPLESETAAKAFIFAPDVVSTAGELAINIHGAMIVDGFIMFNIKVLNGSIDQYSFYPTQGYLIIDGKQIPANRLLSEPELSGVIHPNVIKEGLLAFKVKDMPITRSSVMQLQLGEAFRQNPLKAHPVTIQIDMSKTITNPNS